MIDKSIWEVVRIVDHTGIHKNICMPNNKSASPQFNVNPDDGLAWSVFEDISTDGLGDSAR